MGASTVNRCAHFFHENSSGSFSFPKGLSHQINRKAGMSASAMKRVAYNNAISTPNRIFSSMRALEPGGVRLLNASSTVHMKMG